MRRVDKPVITGSEPVLPPALAERRANLAQARDELRAEIATLRCRLAPLEAEIRGIDAAVEAYTDAMATLAEAPSREPSRNRPTPRARAANQRRQERVDPPPASFVMVPATQTGKEVVPNERSQGSPGDGARQHGAEPSVKAEGSSPNTAAAPLVPDAAQ